MARPPLGAAGGPRPARGAAAGSPPRPSPPASPGRECLVPAAPSPGPEGRAGRAVSYPLLLLPTSSPPRCEPPPPPLLPPLTHAAPGLARCWVWDRVRGWRGAWRRTGWPAPSGGCALRVRAPLAATAREPPSPPPPPQRVSCAPLPRPGRGTAPRAPRESGLRPCGKGVLPLDPCLPGLPVGVGRVIPSLFP